MHRELPKTSKPTQREFFNETSIVIPLHPSDQAQLNNLLEDLRPHDRFKEIIIVGHDIENKHENNLIFLNSPELKRAAQLNAGANIAQADFLWFLHADTRVSEAALGSLKQALSLEADNSIHHFKLAFEKDAHKLVFLNALGANLRSSLFKLPFGDQGFFISKSNFVKLGAYNEKIKVGEDLDLILKCKEENIAIKQIADYLYTSDRKYKKKSWLKTTAGHLFYTLKITLFSKSKSLTT